MSQQVAKDLSIKQSIWDAAIASDERIVKITANNEEVYWLKKASPARGIFRYYALNLFSKILRVPLLKAVPQEGGQTALNVEISRINSLNKAGIFVPKIMATDSGWILLKDLGESIIDELKQNRQNKEIVQNIFMECLNGIKVLHEKGQYMSQGFVRNMLKLTKEPLLDNQFQIGFIDFEDDPLSVMSLHEAQARDLILFVNSTARFFVKDSQFFTQQILQFFEGHSQEVVANIKKTNDKLMWVTKLPFQKALGHDYQKLKIGILALSKVKSI